MNLMHRRLDDHSNSTPRLKSYHDEEVMPQGGDPHRLHPKHFKSSSTLLSSSITMSTRRSASKSTSARQLKHYVANTAGDSESISLTRRVRKSSNLEALASGASSVVNTETNLRRQTLVSPPPCRSSRWLLSSKSVEKTATLSTSSKSELNIAGSEFSISIAGRNGKVPNLPTSLNATASKQAKSLSSSTKLITSSDFSALMSGKVLSCLSPVDEETTTKKDKSKSSQQPDTAMPIIRPRTMSSKKLQGDNLVSSRILCRQCSILSDITMDFSFAALSSRTSLSKLTMSSRSLSSFKTVASKNAVVLRRQYSFLSDVTMDFSSSALSKSRISRAQLTLSSTSISSLKTGVVSYPVDTSGSRPTAPCSSTTASIYEEHSYNEECSTRRRTGTDSPHKERRKSKSTERRDTPRKLLTSQEQTSKTKPVTDLERNPFSKNDPKIPRQLVVGKLHLKKEGKVLSSQKRTNDPKANTFDALKTAFPPDILRQHSVKSNVGLYTTKKSLPRHQSQSRRKSNRSMSGIQCHEIVDTSPISSSSTQTLICYRDPPTRSTREGSKDHLSMKATGTTTDDLCSRTTRGQIQTRTRSQISFAQSDTRKKMKKTCPATAADPISITLKQLSSVPSTSFKKKKRSFQEDAMKSSSKRTGGTRTTALLLKSRPIGDEEEDLSTPLQPRGGVDKSELRGRSLDEEDEDVAPTSPEIIPKRKKSSKKKKTKSSKSSTRYTGRTEVCTKETKGEARRHRPSVYSDIVRYSREATRNRSRPGTKSPPLALNLDLSPQHLNLASDSPSTRSLPASLRDNSGRSERTSGSSRSLREPRHYKSPKDEQFKYMVAQLRLDRQKADEERKALLALKGNLHREGSYKGVESYMKKYIKGSRSSSSISLELSPNGVDLDESCSLPWMFPL